MGFDFVEDQLRKAAEEGKFDNLPGAGKPIAGLQQPYDAQWWARSYLQRERSADASREQVAELEKKLTKVWTLRTEADVRSRVAELNAAANTELFDADSVVASWRQFQRSMRDRS